MSKKKTIHNIKQYIEALKKPMPFRFSNDEKIKMLQDILDIVYKQNYNLCEADELIKAFEKKIDELQKENSKLNMENQALFESINCNDDNMLIRRYEKQQKVIDKMAEYIEDISKDTEVPVHKQAIIDFYYKQVEEEE